MHIYVYVYIVCEVVVQTYDMAKKVARPARISVKK